MTERIIERSETMTLNAEQKQKIVEEFQRKPGDTGSPGRTLQDPQA